MTRAIEFAGMNLELPSEEWKDLTEQTGVNTLAKEDGIGALQFSVATYQSGTRPGVDRTALREMLVDFFERKELGTPATFLDRKGRMTSVSADCRRDGEFIRVWYLSDGDNVVLATYLTSETRDARLIDELRDADQIVASVEISASS